MSDDVGVPPVENFKELKARLAEEQAGMTKDEVMKQLDAEYVADLDNMPKQKHVWVKRGIVVSCEGAMHPSHRHFLVG